MIKRQSGQEIGAGNAEDYRMAHVRGLVAKFTDDIAKTCKFDSAIKYPNVRLDPKLKSFAEYEPKYNEIRIQGDFTSDFGHVIIKGTKAYDLLLRKCIGNHNVPIALLPDRILLRVKDSFDSMLFHECAHAVHDTVTDRVGKVGFFDKVKLLGADPHKGMVLDETVAYLIEGAMSDPSQEALANLVLINQLFAGTDTTAYKRSYVERASLTNRLLDGLEDLKHTYSSLGLGHVESSMYYGARHYGSTAALGLQTLNGEKRSNIMAKVIRAVDYEQLYQTIAPIIAAGQQIMHRHFEILGSGLNQYLQKSTAHTV